MRGQQHPPPGAQHPVQLGEPGAPVGPDLDVVHCEHHVHRGVGLAGVRGATRLDAHPALADQPRAAPAGGLTHRRGRLDTDHMSGLGSRRARHVGGLLGG
jgi:hypothetical protein